MSSFNPNNHAMTAAEWLETAREANGQTRAQFTIVGGVVLGLFAAAAASPVTGVLVAAYFLNKAWKDTQAANRNDRAIDHYGCVAPFLNEADLTDYARQVGPANAAAEIRWALENGFMVKPTALDFLELQGINPDRLLAPARDKQTLPATQSPQQQPEGEQSTGGAIGSNTRLRALDVEAVSEAPLLNDAVPVTHIPRNAAELLARLEVECPELLLLVKAPPIRLVGKQRTGKSTFGRKLALLRSVLLPGHQVAWATPHREADNPVPEALNPFGTTPTGAKNFRAIETAWGAVQNVIDRGEQLNLSAVWDEFGSYDQFEDKGLLGESLRSLLREASKHQYFPILVAHGDQASFYPGVSGILTTLKESTVKVETIGRVANAFGEMAPTNQVEVTYLDSSQTRFKVPEWLTVDLLLSIQPAMTRPAVLDLNLSLNQTYQNISSDTPRYGAEEVEVKEDLSQVFNHIKELLLNAGDKITARKLHRSAGASTVGITSDNASEYMRKLAETESNSFSYSEELNNVGNLSKFLTRIN